MRNFLQGLYARTCVLAAALMLFGTAHAQVSGLYVFSQSNGTYTPITGGTVIGTSTDDDDVYGAMPIGFTFNFNGQPYTQFGTNANGWLSLGSSLPTSDYNAISLGITDNVIAAFNQDLILGFRATGNRTIGSNVLTNVSSTGCVAVGDGITGTGIPAGTTVTAIGANTITISNNASSTGTAANLNFTNGEMRYETIGSSPNQTLVVQWKNVRKYANADDCFNFQIRLNEADNSIDIVYGSVVNNATPTTLEIGLRGVGTTDFNSRTTDTDWSATTAAVNNYDAVTLSSTVVPASGLTFSWALPPACTGSPVAGTAVTSASPVCPSEPFNLSLSGNTAADSLTYQWISSTDGVNYNIEALGTASLFSTSVSVETYFRCIVTCLPSGLSDTSSAVQITLNPFLNCYCSSSAYYTSDEDVLNVTLGSLNNTTTCGSTGGGASQTYLYSDYTASVAAPVLNKTSAYPLSVEIGTCGGNYDNAAAVFIDYNHNGLLTDAGEQVYISSTYTNGPHIENGLVIIPATADTGLTLMRVISDETETLADIVPCGDYYYGETEDYLVDIQPALPCTNPPTAGTITGVSSACTGNTVNLTLTGNTTGTDLQWQVSTDDATWADVNGAINPLYTTPAITDTVYYRVRVTCSDSVFTPSFEITLTPLFNCYCTANLGGFCGDAEINNVNIPLTTLNNNSSCNTAGNGVYTAFPDTGSATASLYINVAYTFNVNLNEPGIISLWIDYNQDGTFAANEWTQLTTNAQTGSQTITIPATALPGLTGMRVRSRLPFNQNDAGSACINFGSGECEDYIINLLPTPPCTTPPVAGAATGIDTVYMPNTGIYVLTGFTGDIQWQYAAAATGPWSGISGANSDTADITFLAPGTYFIRAFVTSPGCDPDSSNVIQTEVIFTGDNVCDALPITVGTNGPYSTYSATVETGEPAPQTGDCNLSGYWCNNDLNNTMWFTLVAPASGRISIQSPDFDTQLAFWDAPNCSSILTGGATLIASNDDDPNSFLHGGVDYSSFIDSITCLTPGKTYYLQLDGYFDPGVTRIIVTDLGAGPDATFNDLPSNICNDGNTIALTPVTAGGSFYGYGIVNNNSLDPQQAYTQVGGQIPFVVYYTFWDCYQSTDTVEVDTLPHLNVTSTTAVACNGGSDGGANITVSGNSPFTFAWSNSTTTEDLSGVAAGAYGVTATDSKGCSVTGSANITEPAPLVPSLDSFFNVSCNGGSDGAVYITITGGVAPYTYNWSNNTTNQDLTGLAAGTYMGTVTDDNGCTLTSPPIPITEPAAIVVTVDSMLTNICAGDMSGRIYITASSGNTPYTYMWSDNSTLEDAVGLAGGNYTVTVVDANGCSATPTTATLTDPPAPVITVDSVKNVSCFGGSDAFIETTGSSGNPSYTYAWSNNATTDDISGLNAGAYTLTITDNTGCTALSSITISEPAQLAISETHVNAACNGASTGSIDLTVAGGTSPYTPAWSNNISTEDQSNLAAGSYSVTITDANMCTANSTVTITQPAAITASTVAVNQIQGGTLGSINLTVSGGTSPFTYNWSNGSSTEDVNNLAAGVFSCTITDANGCTKIVSDTVNLVIGIGDVSSTFGVNLYPNPTESQFFIELNLPQQDNVLIDIYAVNGQLIQTITDKNVLSNKYSIDMSAEAEGVYYARIKVNETTVIRRFVISR